ncbi:hypothetical protein HBA97_00825 [Mycobacteroides chelonae]|uniref:Phthiocerol/phthiodiolone dimycocerosyl transferase n=2 Tax=Mycobacteroides chelonae TaxID=1774 RepID=A0A1S1MA88_MYCCH|nr:hypothetical protein [Mycobacteroides chelonae]OHU78835.1 hypothetical protein BKG84_10945 [Mycobacteroides chelonae]QQG85962.1 hypothetical protein HBA99_00825 [Mycobacteroides chelonae]QQG90779.1 hypothetical protein HBA97_00825 [Mycobacteroides chelonae]
MKSVFEQGDSPLTVLRPLSAHEAMFSTMGVSATFWATTHLRGELNMSSLRQAWQLLTIAHPVLATRIVADGVQLVLTSSPESPAAVEVLDKPLNDLSELPALRFEDGTAVLKVFSQDQSHTVLLGVDHSIADARLGAFYLFMLWHFYTQIVTEGTVPQIIAAPIPDAPETALEHRGILKGALPQKDSFTSTIWGGKQGGEIDELADPPVTWHHRFDQKTTEGVRMAAKTFGVTMHGLITGVIAIAERAQIGAELSDEVNMGFMSPVDFRGHLSPAAAITDVSVGIGMAIGQTRVRANDDPVRIGRRIVEQIQNDLASGVIQQNTHHMESILLANSYGPLITVTNPGIILTPPTPSTLAIEDFRGQLTVSAISDERAPHSPAPSQASGYEVYTFNGQLNIHGRYPGGSFTPQQIAQLREHILTQLNNFAKH